MASVLRSRRKRKFPGPAGILPDIPPVEITGLSKHSALSERISDIIKEDTTVDSGIGSQEPSSQTDSQNSQKSIFDDSPWLKMSALIEAEEKQLSLDQPGRRSITELMNIKWIQKKAPKLRKGHRIPFFMAVMNSVPEIPSTKRSQTKTQCVLLQDKTGTIEAALHPDFVIKYGKELQPGTVFALRNVGLMILKGNLIVTIMRKNVIMMVSSTSNGCASRLNNELAKKGCSESEVEPIIEIDGGAAVFHFAEFHLERIHEAYRKLCESFRQRLGDLNENNVERTRTPPRKRSLFTTVTTSLAVSEESQEINFEDDNEGDEFMSSIMFDDDMEWDAPSQNAEPAAKATVQLQTTKKPTPSPVTSCNGLKNQIEESMFEDDEDFDSIIATCPEGEDIRNSNSSNVPISNADDLFNLEQAIDNL